MRNLSRTVRKKRSTLPLAAPSRTGAWQSRQPRRAQIWVISLYVEGIGEATLVEGAAKGLGEGVGVLCEEELAVAADAAGVVDECDELGLDLARAVGDVWAEHGVGLPHVVGVGLGEGEAAAVVAVGLGCEQLVGVDEPAEGVGIDLVAAQQVALDAGAVDGGDGGGLVVAEGGQDLLDGFLEELWVDLARATFVGARLGGHGGDAIFLVAGVPGLDRAPSELAAQAVFVEEGVGGDVADASDGGSSRRELDGTEYAHLEVGADAFHVNESATMGQVEVAAFAVGGVERLLVGSSFGCQRGRASASGRGGTASAGAAEPFALPLRTNYPKTPT